LYPKVGELQEYPTISGGCRPSLRRIFIRKTKGFSAFIPPEGDPVGEPGGFPFMGNPEMGFQLAVGSSAYFLITRGLLLVRIFLAEQVRIFEVPTGTRCG
jgi:hypothetical protein